MKIIAFILPFTMLLGCLDCRKQYVKYIKPVLIEGVIQRKFRQENHAVPTIEVLGKDGVFNYSPHDDIFKIWELGEIGDSMAKDSGSLEYKLFTSDTVFYFYPECVFPEELGKIENPKFDSYKEGEHGYSVFRKRR